MKNIITYTNNLKEHKWDDFHFDLIKINTLPEFENLDGFDAMDIFSESIFKEIQNITAKSTLKLLIITPDSTSEKAYGIAFLQDKEILTMEIEATPLFNQWLSSINDDASIPKVYTFTSNSNSSRPLFNYEKELTHKGMGEFICSQVPNSFIAEKLSKEKADFLTPFIQLNACDDFELIEQYFKTLVKQNNLNVIEPKNNEAIYAEFENEAGFAFPAILKSFLTLHNGVENTAFMSVQRILKEWRDWQSIYNEWTQEELFDTDNESNTKTVPMYVTPYWIPFFKLGGGNFIALDFAPNTKGTSGQVVSFGADEQSAIYEAKTLSEFLKGFITADSSNN
ncbi:SMI1/KNR4 family protein [Pseudoalteromonas sp. S558]|uniref:SMI1/KNR4 family protein n=1 Tax=Pseudoalteromonas sp. S558 TaxID=2066515 RepID=UPI00110A64A7|nr:SMI1/KNR4 family protein [Pseudoalteromonas sp. S558]TMN95549.1 cell wall assembly/cell proliferation coordinating protein [Pseudoalteromonas sp. S558]